MSEISSDPFAVFDQSGSSQQKSSDEVIEEFCNAYKKETAISSLTDSMAQYDKNVVEIQLVRQKLAKKLMKTVMKMNMDVDASSDPDSVIARSKILAEARGLLNDLDTSAKNHTATKLKYKDSETQANAVFNAADLLSKIKISVENNTPNTVTSPEDINNKIEEKFSEKNLVIPDTELETGGNKLPNHKEKTEE